MTQDKAGLMACFYCAKLFQQPEDDPHMIECPECSVEAQAAEEEEADYENEAE